VVLLVSALVVAALLVIGLSTGGGSNEPGPGKGGAAGGKEAVGKAKNAGEVGAKPAPRGHSLQILAGGEVWVCLLSEKGNPLIDGRILAPGEAEGPFRSGSFTLALGNGAVKITVDGQRQKLPEPASPIGFAVDSKGSVRELPEGERPTCT
jgi:hypothetical protein